MMNSISEIKNNVKSDWFLIRKPNPQARLRIFCFPYAGGSASTFLSWKELIEKEGVELVTVQLPGRANRFNEPAFSAMNDLVNDLYPKIKSLMDKPYMIFGHSMGGYIGFELLKRVVADGGRIPEHFIASGSRPPHLSDAGDPVYKLSSSVFMERLVKFNGTPEMVLQNPEYMELFLPLLRADFELAMTYCSEIEEPLDCKMSLFLGEEDDMLGEHVVPEWQKHFLGKIQCFCFQGDHFFIEKNKQNVIKQVCKIADQYIKVEEVNAD